MERGEAVKGMEQSPLDSQIDRPNSFSQLNTSSDGRSDNLNRSIQPSKVRISQRRSKLRRDKGPYPTLPLLNCAGNGRITSRMSSPPLPILGSDIDANAQGHASAAGQAGASQGGAGSN
ncbi:hypothetical protein SLE2022_262980 [Rubroshorea leprosula]